MSYALHPLKLWLDCCWSIPLTCFHTYPRTWKVLWFILVFFGMHSNRKLIWEFEFTMNVTWSLVHEQHLVWYTQATHASSSTCNEQHQAGLMARNKRFFTYHYTYVLILGIRCSKIQDSFANRDIFPSVSDFPISEQGHRDREGPLCNFLYRQFPPFFRDDLSTIQVQYSYDYKPFVLFSQ